jgi:hypothetical protein
MSDFCNLRRGTGSKKGSFLSQSNVFSIEGLFDLIKTGMKSASPFFHCEEAVPSMHVPTMTPIRDRRRGRRYEIYSISIALGLARSYYGEGTVTGRSEEIKGNGL